MATQMYPGALRTMPPDDPNPAQTAAAVARFVMQALALPFDTTRSLYALAAQVGLVERSMLRHREFERALGAIERLSLGLWARRA